MESMSAGPIAKFAFVVHPLSVEDVRRSAHFRWARTLPDAVVESVAARMPPFPIGKVVGGHSPATGARIEGLLIALGTTPREMMRRSPEFTYRRLYLAARMAHRAGARLMGLGAFTSVVGDAGLTVARHAPLAITSGNSLTVATTLEAAKQAVLRMDMSDPSCTRAMIIGATGSIGSVCSRMIAQAVRDVVLVSIEPDRLRDLRRLILDESPATRVVVATRSDTEIGDCDLIVTATSAFGERILDISRCKPGAVICDVARPPDVGAAEAALRPDVVVVESGEVWIPGVEDLGYDLGLPRGVSYACLAETALLAMDGRFESFTLGRDLQVGRVKEIFRLFRKHGFRLAGLRSPTGPLDDAEFDFKRRFAQALRGDEPRLARLRGEASAALARIPPSAKGIVAAQSQRSANI